MKNRKHIDYWYILSGIQEAQGRQRKEYRNHYLCRLLAHSECNIGSKSK